MANEPLAAIWEYMRLHGLKVSESELTASFGGQQGVVQVPADLVATKATDGVEEDSEG